MTKMTTKQFLQPVELLAKNTTEIVTGAFYLQCPAEKIGSESRGVFSATIDKITHATYSQICLLDSLYN
jgi:hypothetical protein